MSEDARKKVDVSPTRPSSRPCPRVACSAVPARSWSTSRTARSCASGRSTATGSTTARASRPGRSSATAHVLEPLSRRSPRRTASPTRSAPTRPTGSSIRSSGSTGTPNGERNPQNRGKSKYVRISWDEATDLIADEIRRIHEEVRAPGAILVQGDGHGEMQDRPRAARPHRAACSTRWAASPSRSATRTAGKAGTGAPSTSGARASMGMMAPQRQHREGHQREQRHGPRVGLRRRDHALGLHAASSPAALLLLDRDRHQAGLHLPRPQLRARPSTPTSGSRAAQHRRRPAAGHHLHVDHRRHLRQGVRRDPHRRLRQGRRPTCWARKTASPRRPSGPRPSAACPSGPSRRWPATGPRRCTAIVHYFGGAHGPRPVLHEPARLECVLLGMQGLGKPGVHQCQIAYFGMPRSRRRSTRLSATSTRRSSEHLRVAAPQSSVDAWGTQNSSPRPSSRTPSSRRRCNFCGHRRPRSADRRPVHRSTVTPSPRKRAAPSST